MSRFFTRVVPLACATLLGVVPAARPLAAAAPRPAGDTPVPAAPKSSEPEWEMRTYVMGLLYRGEKWTPEKTPETEKIQAGHMAHISAMAEGGKLILAGPFMDNTDLRGIFLFKLESVDEAKALCDEDPAVKSGRLRVELHPWYGAANIIVLRTAPPAAPTPAAR